jgi:hypothetical protein
MLKLLLVVALAAIDGLARDGAWLLVKLGSDRGFMPDFE